MIKNKYINKLIIQVTAAATTELELKIFFVK